jgi:putative ABC transport system permease protein
MQSRVFLFIKLFRESFLFAFEALRVNKLRTFLSLLGITIGIFAIISVFTVTDALERKIRTDVESLGNNVIYVQKWPWVPEGGGDGEYPWWKYLNRPLPGYKEMEDLLHRVNSVEAGAYVAQIGGQLLKYKNSSVENAQILCVSQDYDRIKSFELEEGRYFTEGESNSGRPICLLGANVKEALFPSSNAIGEQISVRGSKLTVIGVFKKEGKSMVDISSDDNVVIPVNFARNLVNLRSDRIDPYIMVKAKEGIAVTEMRDELKGAMRGIRKLSPKEDDDFALNEISLLSSSLNSLFGTLGIAGWIIGGFSILVGGFGIANIMFVSVKERTSIIGIQKSLGSKNYFILLQFLVESVVLCIFGGIIGLLVVYGLTTLVSGSFEDFKFVLTAGNITMGICISAVIGIISGFIPAMQASQMNPVDAIRSN